MTRVNAANVPSGRGAGSDPVLRQGSRGPAVRDMQQLLKSQGFDPGPIDGDFGPGTEVAVMRFQSENGLDADGIVGGDRQHQRPHLHERHLVEARRRSGGGDVPPP